MRLNVPIEKDNHSSREAKSYNHLSMIKHTKSSTNDKFSTNPYLLPTGHNKPKESIWIIQFYF